jgi:hypothetical protein
MHNGNNKRRSQMKIEQDEKRKKEKQPKSETKM